MKTITDNTCLPMNGYSQEIPKVSDFNEPPTMPFNLTKNTLDEAINDIPYHNPEFSKELMKSKKENEIKPIFKDKNLRPPAHISLSHVFTIPKTECPNTKVCGITQSIKRKKFVTTIFYSDLKA